jgi:hypothetical protein
MSWIVPVVSTTGRDCVSSHSRDSSVGFAPPAPPRPPSKGTGLGWGFVKSSRRTVVFRDELVFNAHMHGA